MTGNNMDNFTDDASPKAGVPTGSGAVGFTTQTDLRQYRQIRQTLLYGAELAKRYVGNESSVTAPGAYYMRDTRVPKAMKNLAALMMDLELIKRDRDDLKAMLAKGSFRRTAEAHYDAWMSLANAALDIADKLPPEMGLSADTMRMFAERIRLQGQWLRATVARAEQDNKRLREALGKCTGYLLNAKIDIETGAPRRTALATIEGGLNMARAALKTGEQAL